MAQDQILQHDPIQPPEPPTKIVSLDGSYYYIDNGTHNPTGWLLVEGAEPMHGLDWLPFAFWDVRTERPTKAVPATEAEAARYAERNIAAGGPFAVERTPQKSVASENQNPTVFNMPQQSVIVSDIDFEAAYARYLDAFEQGKVPHPILTTVKPEPTTITSIVRCDAETAQVMADAWALYREQRPDVTLPHLLLLPNDEPNPAWLTSKAFKQAVLQIIAQAMDGDGK